MDGLSFDFNSIVFLNRSAFAEWFFLSNTLTFYGTRQISIYI